MWDAPTVSEGPKVVPIGSQDINLQYIKGTFGPLVFCMGTACTERCPTYGAKTETFLQNVSQQ